MLLTVTNPRQKSTNDAGYTSYFLEKISELPVDKCGNTCTSDGRSVEDSDCTGLTLENSASFPSKLYKCLVDAEKNGFADVISWQQDGVSFKVHNQERFGNEILPMYFGAIKFKSWQRQLNLYGFTRVQKGLTRGSYTHEHFVRGRKALSLEISRQKWGQPHDSPSSTNKMQGSEDRALEAMVDYLHGSLPLNGSCIDAAQTKAPYTSTLSDTSGLGWDVDLLAMKDALVPVPQPSSDSASRCPGNEPSLHGWDTMSIDCSTDAVIPSAEELSFLLDCDDKQLSKKTPDQVPSSQRKSQESCGMQSSICYLGRSTFNMTAKSLETIANTLPSAHDLTIDLAVEDNTSHPVKVLSKEWTLQRTATAAAVTEHRSFPWKLHEMLSDVESNGFQGIISWEPGGMAFKVHDSRLFVEKVMPLYFDQSRYESFRRQLRKYGFSRLQKDRYRGAYHHRFFQRANKQLCKYIQRGNRQNPSKEKVKSEIKKEES